MNSDSYFYLYELDNDTLNFILSLSSQDLEKYLHSLIQRFYSKSLSDKEQYFKLVEAYKSSFALEKLYRVNKLIHANFTCIYTSTGLIRDVVLDLYSITPEKVVIN